MVVCIHIRKSGQYWSESGEWTARQTAARNFLSAAEAEKFCQDMKLTDVEIFVMRDGRPPLAIPIRTGARAM